MPLMRKNDQTPCGALFDILKRCGGISHKELATLILSERPLFDGRSPASRANDRTWVSRFIVHAPVDSTRDRYFRDYGVAAQRVMNRLHATRRGGMTCARILAMICGEPGRPMVDALGACHEDICLYQNALARIRDGEGYTTGERAEVAMVLFVVAGCSASVSRSVDYAMSYVHSVMGGRIGTPTLCPASFDSRNMEIDVEPARALGFVRVVDGVIASEPYWVSSDFGGVEIGALATGVNDITDVEGDVSAHHACVWYEAPGAECAASAGKSGFTSPGACFGQGIPSGRWLLRDLGSRNGTVVIAGDGSAPLRVKEDKTVEVHPGDEVRFGANTAFILVEGVADMAR